MIFIDILSFLLLLLVLILLSVLFIPFEYSAMGHKDEDAFEVSAHLSWFFKGFIFSFIKQNGVKSRLSFKIFGFEVNSGNKKKTEKKEKKKKEKKKKDSRKNIGKVLNREFIEQCFRAVNNVFRHLKPRLIVIEGVFGFDDPYYTGLACIPVYCIPLNGDNYNISITPVFNEKILRGRFNIQGRIVMAVILWVALKFPLSRPVRNIIFKKERKIKNYATQS